MYAHFCRTPSPPLADRPRPDRGQRRGAQAADPGSGGRPPHGAVLPQGGATQGTRALLRAWFNARLRSSFQQHPRHPFCSRLILARSVIHFFLCVICEELDVDVFRRSPARPSVSRALHLQGLLQVVTGRGAEIGDYLTQHPGANMISFTGGDTGIAISKKAGMVPLQVGP